MQPFTDPCTAAIVDFLRRIGLEVEHGVLDDTAFLPGVALCGGRILVDESRLRHPGDLLHEAGHLAVIPAHRRGDTAGRLGTDGGEEMGAIAWSYAAALHLGLDAATLFHNDGYRGGASALVDNFREGRYIGVPYLQWLGLTLEPARAARQGCPPYPHMVRWLCA